MNVWIPLQGRAVDSSNEQSLDRNVRSAVSLPLNMAWATPAFARAEVDAAGDFLVGLRKGRLYPEDEYEYRFATISNWRSTHSFPLNTFQVGLRHRSRRVDRNSLVAQRIKRLSSIESKLRRFGWLKLSEMQDVGGCRAVMRSVRAVKQVVELYKHSEIKHRLDDEDDYIISPKRSGYRGIHLIYRYYSDRKDTYNGLKIEIQLRSVLQHAWATAVETVGTFVGQALKSSRGEREWLRFFALMGSAIAIRERTFHVPDTPTKTQELVRELREYANMLDVERRLEAYGTALKTLEQPGAQGATYFLLSLDAEAKSITITGYKSMEFDKASSDYLETEKAISGRAGTDAVLVSVESLAALRRAYPNYFFDTTVFLREVRRARSGEGL